MSIADAQYVADHRCDCNAVRVGQSPFEPHAGSRKFLEEIIVEDGMELLADPFEFGQFFADAFLLRSVALVI